MLALLHLAPPRFLDVLLYFQPSLDILLRFNLSLPAEFHLFLVESRSIPLLRFPVLSSTHRATNEREFDGGKARLSRVTAGVYSAT